MIGEKWHEAIGNSTLTTECLAKSNWWYMVLANMQVYSITEWAQEAQVLILSLFFMFSIIFYFVRTFSITLIFDKRYMCCSMNVQYSPYKYVSYRLASYYLSLFRSGIYWIKSIDSSVCFSFYHNFLRLHKRLVSSVEFS